MIKAAELLFKAPVADKPTVLLMIDRNELEDQMLKNLAALGLGNVEHANSISALNKLLKDDYRGIIVCMVHKFRDMPANINTRKNILHSRRVVRQMRGQTLQRLWGLGEGVCLNTTRPCRVTIGTSYFKAMKDVFELFHQQFGERYARHSDLDLTEDVFRYDFFAALMHARGLRSWEIQLEHPIDSRAYVPRNNEKSKRGEKPQLDLAFGDGAERTYVEFAMFKRNSVEGSPINDTENAFKILNDMLRLALQVHVANGSGYFVSVADYTMLGKRLSRSGRFEAFPAERYEFDHAVLQDLMNLYVVGKKIDTRFLEKLQQTGITVRAARVFECDLKPPVTGKMSTLISAWKVEALL